MSERDSREGNTKLDTMADAAAAAMRAARPQRCDLLVVYPRQPAHITAYLRAGSLRGHRPAEQRIEDYAGIVRILHSTKCCYLVSRLMRLPRMSSHRHFHGERGLCTA